MRSDGTKRPLAYILAIMVAFLLTASGIWIIMAGGSADPSDEFLTEFDELRSKELYAHSSWGLMVLDPESNTTLVDVRSGEMFVPGSTTKLFTSAAIMMALGADHRFVTPVYATSMDENGVAGNVVLVASGDPNMGGRALENGGINYTDEDHSYALIQGGCILVSEDPLAGIDSLARQIYESGVRAVGDVVIDDSIFETVEMEEFVISPTIINDNLLDIMVRPGAVDGGANITVRPATDFFTIRNEVVTSDATDITITASGRDITVRGQIAEGSGQVNLTHTVREPAAFARALLIESLERHEIDVGSDAMGENPRSLIPSDYEGAVKLAEIKSAPLSEEVKLTLKVSHNLHAETYLSLMAASRGGSNSYEGMVVEREMLERLGIDLSAMCLSDGMGGATEDRFTPSAAIQLLKAMMEKEEFERFFGSLPVLGVDGSLAHSAADGSPAIGKVHAKTGTRAVYNVLGDTGMAQTKALAGYIDAASGKRVVFALFVNNVMVNDFDDIMALGNDVALVTDMIYRHF